MESLFGARRRITSPFDPALFPPYFVACRSHSTTMLPPRASSGEKIARLKRGTYFSPAPWREIMAKFVEKPSGYDNKNQ